MKKRFSGKINFIKIEKNIIKLEGFQIVTLREITLLPCYVRKIHRRILQTQRLTVTLPQPDQLYCPRGTMEI